MIAPPFSLADTTIAPGVRAGIGATTEALAYFSAPRAGATASGRVLAVCRPLDDCGELRADLRGNIREPVVADDREHPLGVDRRDLGLAVALVHHDVAGQERAELRFGRQRLVGEARVAGAEDGVGLALDAELLAQGRLDVDLTQDAEAFLLQLGADPLDGVGER